ncbi:hypothetical protein NIIDNTM18_04800 [Mycolicibacterium litorale]|uniref:Uncharacterized protein n=1 Tax=Mycolicibacterium litorale TaxID=758802 RepID=A0A6S6NZE4_9MYCO|nr:hypothetical protein NIIDNTM18_04800 [Mycolicibacterium litorale]
MVRVDVCREDEDRSVGQFSLDDACHVDTVAGVVWRHPDVQYGEIRLGLPYLGERVMSIARSAHHLESGSNEQAAQAFSKQHLVLGDNHPGTGHALLLDRPTAVASYSTTLSAAMPIPGAGLRRRRPSV